MVESFGNSAKKPDLSSFVRKLGRLVATGNFDLGAKESPGNRNWTTGQSVEFPYAVAEFPAETARPSTPILKSWSRTPSVALSVAMKIAPPFLTKSFKSPR